MHKDSESKRRQRASSMGEAYRQAHEVMSAGLSIVVCAGAGYWLDLKLGWMPALTIVGAVMGCAAATVSLRSLLRRLDRETKQRGGSDAVSAKPDGVAADTVATSSGHQEAGDKEAQSG